MNSYKSYLRRKHANVDLKAIIDDRDEVYSDSESVGEEVNLDQADDQNHFMNENEEECEEEENKRLDALYVLKTREINQLTQTAVNNIVEDSTILVRNTVEKVRKGVEECLEDAGILLDSIPGLQQLFKDDHPISNPLQHVSTKHKQASYFKVNFGLVVSSQCVSN